jgi:hypothetical protein
MQLRKAPVHARGFAFKTNRIREKRRILSAEGQYLGH